MKIGLALKYYRELNQMTQWDLSIKSGINEKYYGRLERDESSPTLNKLELVCNSLNIEVSRLIKTAENINKGGEEWLEKKR